ncbi:single-strand DNA-binding protein [Amycolatopsis marina]|uniref:Single-strand DNA-binding protein n=1 Tax=Amycolatopsis marina TaxID=490629 RepID=A0A1I0ZP54_9PSEU|nr:single-stranded DNA-binding protein [Amycolatopsis marina]SFB26240.1 single-strand DNA-binding protein [Amycolatopsis marina]
MGETVVTVIGTVVSELSRRELSSGVSVTSFWMRSTERRRDSGSGAWVDGRQLAVRVSCWRALAESVHGSLGKGDPVIVTGRLYTGDAEVGGQSRAVPELEAFAMGPNLSRCSALVRRSGPGAAGVSEAAVTRENRVAAP